MMQIAWPWWKIQSSPQRREKTSQTGRTPPPEEFWLCARRRKPPTPTLTLKTLKKKVKKPLIGEEKTLHLTIL